jgi:hypothetical protein
LSRSEAFLRGNVKFHHFINVSAVVGTDTVPVVAPAGTLRNVCSGVIRTSSSTISQYKGIRNLYQKVAQGKVEYTSDPSVAEAGEIVATVVSLSIIVPVAEAVPEAM